MSDELCYLSAADAIASFRTGSLSPVDLMTAVIERAAGVNSSVNAFTEELADEALDAARTAEDRYRRGEPAGPLDGVPVATKEEQPIAGRTHSEGCAQHASDVAKISHPIIERIVDAGGIIHARTTTPEFCAAGFTHTAMWGVTRNPWNPAYSSGGSSGGSGAALAAGMTTLATGSDIGGSIRIPAAFNGVVGFKPPYGRVPGLAPMNLDHYCHDGPMARTVADCALLQNVIAGRHPGDPVSLPWPPAVDGDPLAEGRRVALCMTLGDFVVEPEVEAAVREAAARLEAAGAAVTEIRLPWTRRELMAAAWVHYGSIFSGYIRSVMTPEQIERLEPYTRDFVRRGSQALEERGYIDALETEAAVHEALASVFAEHDVLVCPTSGVAGFLAGEDYVDAPLTVNGIELDHHLEGPLTVPFNIASRCPVISVPTGRTSDGLPVGLQIVAPPYDDQAAFGVAAAVERAYEWYRTPGSRPVPGVRW
ncbi:MAG: amidase [Nocardioidaceae bacterium]